MEESHSFRPSDDLRQPARSAMGLSLLPWPTNRPAPMPPDGGIVGHAVASPAPAEVRKRSVSGCLPTSREEMGVAIGKSD